MKKISEMIIEEGIENLPIQKQRTTVRGIMIKDKKVLLVYSKEFLDYTFPGGGMKVNEAHMDALRRELKEELGADEIKHIEPFGYIEEKRFGINSDTVYLQTSYYYFVEVTKFGKQMLGEREMMHGVEPIFVSADEAIKQNLIVLQHKKGKKGMRTVLPREIKVLEKLKDEGFI
ncbi:NUDIX hydrolase [Acholeplasma hippikon]|uniref:NUDIX hydrolase n=1 Tax=Acholeplasma hippikon TaxID=264636 RepID=UPI00138E336F|nr:NUDIX domain-containing protein [Acholeplasma hippikon]